MALQSSGPISLADIEGEFGGSGSISLSEYYGAADGVPTSGTISFEDFYGTSAYNGPPDVEMWLVGGGGGGGSVFGTMVPGAGGGGSGGGINNETSDPITAGQVFTITIGAGGAADNNGQDTTVVHDNIGATYVGPKGGRGGSCNNGSLDQAPQRGGGGPGLVSDANTANMNGASGTSGNGAIGSGGDGAVNNGNAGGGGGGGYPSGNNSFQDAFVNVMSQFVAGRGQYGINFTQGVPTTLQLGYGGGGGVSDGVINSGGASGTNCTAAYTNANSYGNGGGGGAFDYSCTTVSAGATGNAGVAIIQYSDTYDAPSALTGTYTAYNQDGYRTYVFTGNGTITW